MKFSELKTGDYFRFQSDIDHGHNCLHRKLLGPVSYLYTKTLEAFSYPSYDDEVVLCDENGEQIERLFSFDEIPDGSFFYRCSDSNVYTRLKTGKHMISFFQDKSRPEVQLPLNDGSIWKVIPKPDWLNINIKG